MSAQITILMDPGAEITVIALQDWPKGWPLDSTTKGLVGVGGVSDTFQSRDMLTIKTREGSLYNVMGQGKFTLSFPENF